MGFGFQPTHPSRGATNYISDRLIEALLFQPTHPSRGATGLSNIGSARHNISTHAPLTGCDRHAIQGGFTFSRNFNPRTPHGVRLPFPSMCAANRYFNPRTPHGVRHSTLFSGSLSTTYFNPRTPHGVRLRLRALHVLSAEFQPTHPSRGATVCILHGHFYAPCISTHAPLTGCDPTVRRVNIFHIQFQPTHPSRGATSLYG